MVSSTEVLVEMASGVLLPVGTSPQVGIIRDKAAVTQVDRRDIGIWQDPLLCVQCYTSPPVVVVVSGNYGVRRATMEDGAVVWWYC